MGLDIAAFEFATKLDPQPSPDYDWLWDLEDVQRVYANKAFAHALAGIDVKPSDRFGLDGGWFMVSGRTKRFRAGSYGGYSSFREALAAAAIGTSPEAVWADPDKHAGRPFFELIHFSDCEGCMTAPVAANLFRDFQEQRETVLPKWDPDDAAEAWLREKYDDWQEAFELAAGSGLVVFR